MAGIAFNSALLGLLGPGRELAAPQDLPARRLHRAHGLVDVGGVGEAEAEVVDPAGLPVVCALFERDHKRLFRSFCGFFFRNSLGYSETKEP